MTKIVVVMDGGIVQNIIADEDVEVRLIDYDTEGADEAEELYEVFGNEAYLAQVEVEVNRNDVKEVFEIQL